MKLLRSLDWPTWFLPVLATLGVRQGREYVLSRIAAIVAAAVFNGLMVIMLPPWTAVGAAPSAWLAGAFWAGYCSESAPKEVTHDVLGACTAIIAVALLRLAFWGLFKF